ncbi:acylphosphatase [Bifidobacterium sp. 64T4]|uniref:acylphosphatase n=1 Tax=Bifidobacterium pongonis TaxID=2834432 RepID=UPI001C55B793|nr:acylphosphatase [Bifidobacterium pongonis]
MRDEACDELRIHAVVSGMVQGVGYRYFTVTTALKLGLTGWVRNLMNGDVELEAQGARRDVAVLISRLKLGPKWSEVSHVAVDEIDPLPNETNFRVRGY